MITVSVLDLSPITQGSDASAALAHSLDLARHAERWGYRRFWVAEHHNMPGIASAATSVVIAHVAGGTRAIRVGAGGIMLPNHAPRRRRAVRHAGIALSRPDRSRARARARDGSTDRARAAPHAGDGSRRLPPRCT